MLISLTVHRTHRSNHDVVSDTIPFHRSSNIKTKLLWCLLEAFLINITISRQHAHTIVYTVKKLKLEMFDVISKHTWQWSSDDFEWDKIFMIWSSRRDRGTFAEPSGKSTSAKLWISKRERPWSQLFKTSKIFKKLLLRTKLWWFKKSSVFFKPLMCKILNIRVDLRSDNEI